jgi:hypothetical protein
MRMKNPEPVKSSPDSTDLFACKMAKKLGFWIEMAGDVPVLCWVQGGRRPADDTQLSMWVSLRYHFDAKTWVVPSKGTVATLKTKEHKA